MTAIMAEWEKYKKLNEQQQQKPYTRVEETTGVQTQNRFQDLEVVEDTQMDINNDDEQQPFELVKTKLKIKNTNKTVTTNNKQSTGTVQKSKTTNTNKQNDTIKDTYTKKNVKPPPINIHAQQINDTIKLMKGLNIQGFHIKRINNYKHTLNIETMEDHREAKKTLEEVKTPFFTYTPKSEKPKTIVLKGLHEEEDLEEIKTLIQAQNINVTNITQLKTKQSKINDRKLPLYIVQCAPDTNMGHILNIKTLNYQTVTWEPLKKTEVIMQCHHCQRFGHAAANCNLDYRCVKCNKQHNPGECKIKETIDKTEIFCTNCNTNGHPASYRGCPIYIATIERLRNKIKEKRKTQQQQQPTQIPITKRTYVSRENGSFAEMLRGNSTQQPGLGLSEKSTNKNNNSEDAIQKLTKQIEMVNTKVEAQGAQLSQLMNLIQQLTQ